MLIACEYKGTADAAAGDERPQQAGRELNGRAIRAPDPNHADVTAVVVKVLLR